MTLLNTVNVGGTNFGLANNSVLGTCATPAGSEVKVCTFSDSFELQAGLNIAVKFTYANTYGDGSTTYPKLSVNGTSYPIRRSDDSYVRSGDWANGQTAVFMFNGTDFIFTNPSPSTAYTLASLPTDAVLHYSFDEVPDYPDGTAVYYKNKNWTTVDGWTNWIASFGTVSVENELLINTRTSDDSQSALQKLINIPAESIIKLELCDTVDTTVNFYLIVGEDYSRVGQLALKANIAQEYIFVAGSNATGVMFRNNTGTGAGKLKLNAIYIGNGSYSTPVIDNANGQNNAVNNGGIATKGVGGKGVLGFYTTMANAGAFNFTNNFTISIWVKPANNTANLDGDILFKSECIVIRNGWNDGTNRLMLLIWNTNTNTYNAYYLTAALLIANTWQHLVITKNGTSIRFYLDGVLIIGLTLTFENVSTNSSNLIVHRGTQYTRETSYDDLLIFDRALTADEVMALYLNRGNTPKYYSWADWKLHQMEQS